MKLRRITCSDPREHNSIKSIIDLAHLPHAEIAVQCHPSKMSDGMPRNIWFNELLHETLQTSRILLAIHVNAEWADSICRQGKIPEIVLNWLKTERCRYNPIIKRIQLNMSKTTADNINAKLLAEIIHDFPRQEFIFQYNDKTQNGIKKLHRTGAKFSLLYDMSGGNGIQPETWEKPVYKTHPMGYSGGISPENVMQNLGKINKILPNDYETWIDAEGKLKSMTLFDEKPLFDASLAKEYVRRANLWQKQH